ncbi:MAG: phosphotransferase [Eubacterium sp.]|nr:phosphotransferase [Eubacterium sp.]
MNIADKKLILKGWSDDKKYCITDENGERFFLRISDISQYDKKQSEFMMMQRVASLEIPMCLPIEFGICKEGVYSVHSWIDGESAEDLIQLLSHREQYNYGLEAGRILRKIHSIPAPDSQEDWAVRFNRKIDTKIRNYGRCPVKYSKGQAFIDCINANRHLLSGRPQTYQHGDYHIGNMMIDRNRVLYIIDFNRNDYGDPWEEFNRIVWCAQKSSCFASGMVDGYFDNDVPVDFWKLLALYISSNTLSSVYWAIPYGEAEVNTMLNQAEEVLTWFDDMTNTVPTWYMNGMVAD